jgi:hypothetical protein
MFWEVCSPVTLIFVDIGPSTEKFICFSLGWLEHVRGVDTVLGLLTKEYWNATISWIPLNCGATAVATHTHIHTHRADVLSDGEICVLNSTSFSICLCLSLSLFGGWRGDCLHSMVREFCSRGCASYVLPPNRYPEHLHLQQSSHDFRTWKPLEYLVFFSCFILFWS